jgi:hypothetical protein
MQFQSLTGQMPVKCWQESLILFSTANYRFNNHHKNKTIWAAEQHNFNCLNNKSTSKHQVNEAD